ncbi:hypothetical protein BJX66DRAFT_294364 [Aspergillus keveii]|uniref:Uncharacterized protein n=1 Tax=Aspergillus keveii TaxID=714993 RepID=A0ABR4GIQ1_9EURO
MTAAWVGYCRARIRRHRNNQDISCFSSVIPSSSVYLLMYLASRQSRRSLLVPCI